MADTVIGIKVTATGITTVTSDLKSMGKAAEQADDKLKGIDRGAKSARDSLGGVGGGASSAKDSLGGVGSSADGLGGKLSSLAVGGIGKLVAGFATLGAAAAGAGAALGTAVVKNFADYEQNVGGVETLFKDSADKVKAYADEAYKTAGLSANQYMESVTGFSASLLQGLGGDTEKAADIANMAMIDMSDNAAKFGTDISTIQEAYQGFAKDNFDMLDNLKLGYGGTQEEMARLINDSGVLGDSMQVTAETVKDVSFDKMIEALHVVQDRMGITGTTAKESAATISGSIATLQGAWSNLLVGLGRSDADVSKLATNVITSFKQVVDNILPVVENLGSNVFKLAPKIAEAGKVIAELIAKAAPVVIQAGVSVITGLLQGLSEAGPALVEGLADVISDLANNLPQIMHSLTEGIMKILISLGENLARIAPDIIPDIVQALVTGINNILIYLPDLLAVIPPLLMGIADGILQALPIILDVLPTLVSSITKALITYMPLIMEAWAYIIDAVIKALPGLVAEIGKALNDAITAAINEFRPDGNKLDSFAESVWQWLKNLVSSISDWGKSLYNSVGSIIEGSISAVLTKVENIKQGIKDLYNGVTSKVLETVFSVVSGISDIFHSLIQNIGSKALSLYNAAVSAGSSIVQGILSAVSGAYEIAQNIVNTIVGGLANAGSWLIESGSNILKYIWQGVVNGLSFLGNIGSEIIQWISTSIQNSISYIYNVASTIGGAISNGIKSSAGSVGSAALEIMNSFSQTIQNGVSTLQSKGSQIVSNLVNGIRSGIGNVKNAMQSITQTVWNGTERIYRDMITAGKNLVTGLWNGIVNKAQWLYNKIVNWANNIVKSVFRSFGIQSPSRVFRDEVGKNIVLGFAEGIDNNSHLVVKSVGNMAKDVTNEAKGLREGLAGELQTLAGNIDKFSEALDKTFSKRSSNPSQNIGIQGSSSTISQMKKEGISLKSALNQYKKDALGHIADVKERLSIAWDEVSIAFEGDDYGLGALSSFIGEDNARKVTRTAREIGSSIRKAQDFVENSIKKYQNSIVAQIRDTQENISIAWDEITVAFEGDDYGRGALTALFGEEASIQIIQVSTLIGEKVREIQGQLQAFSQEAQNMAQSAWVNLETMFKTTVNQVNSWISPMVVSGEMFFNSIVSRIESVKMRVSSSMSYLASTAISEINKHVSPMTVRGQEFIQSITRNYNLASQKVNNDINQVVNGAVREVDRRTGGMVTAGQNLVGGMWQGITSRGSQFHREVSNWAHGIVNQVRRDLGIHSPSRVFRDEIGRHLPTGLAEGIKLNAHVVISSLDSLNDQMILSVKDNPLLAKTDSRSSQNLPTFYPTVIPPSHKEISNDNSTTFKAPLIHVQNMTVRNDQDIRTLSEQLHRDISREMRAQGVLR